MNVKGKLSLFLLALLLLFGGIGLETAYSQNPPPEYVEVEAQATLPSLTEPAATPPPEATAPSGGGGQNSSMFVILIAIVFVAVVGLILVAMRGRPGPGGL